MINAAALKHWSTWLIGFLAMLLSLVIDLPTWFNAIVAVFPGLDERLVLQAGQWVALAALVARFVSQGWIIGKLKSFVAWARLMGIAGAVTAKRAGAGAAGALVLAMAIIAPWEDKINDPYYDIVGVKTVCYGETQGVQDRHYSDAECSAMLRAAVEIRFLKPVIDCVPQIADRPRVLAASTSLAYNIGTTAFCGSTAARRLRTGDLRGGCEAFMMWTKAGGKVRQGLINRRMAERKVCLAGAA